VSINLSQVVHPTLRGVAVDKYLLLDRVNKIARHQDIGDNEYCLYEVTIKPVLNMANPPGLITWSLPSSSEEESK
jgi:hypothetical protein